MLKDSNQNLEPEKIPEEQKKDYILWFIVSFFMILIIVFWFISFKNSLKNNTDNENGDLGDITNSFEQSLGELKTNLNDIQVQDNSTGTSSLDTEDEQNIQDIEP